MRIAIIQFPGSNCERETMLAVKRAGMEPVEFLWNETKTSLADFAGYIIVGGFSYEDRSRAGVIAAWDPIMQIIQEQSVIGKPILGICNGAQILVEAGLVPGVEDNKLSLALTDNKRIQQNKILGTGFYNAWVFMRLSDHYQYNAFTRHIKPDTIFSIPVAHGEGRFVIPPALLLEMQENGLNLFQYCDAEGRIIDEFPVNPNGSMNNIAAISNKAGNVMAMMPHPERTPNGDVIFQSMRDYILQDAKQTVPSLYYYPRPADILPFKTSAREIIIELLITDNHALSVQSTLKRLHFPITIQRKIHWEVLCHSEETFEAIKNSGVLFNDRKENAINLPAVNHDRQKTFLVRAKDDLLGQQKVQLLQDHFGLLDVQAIHHGVLWQMEGPLDIINQVLHSYILFNPYGHDCYEYNNPS